MNTLLIIGATSGMASECAKIWINDKKNKYEKVILVARNKEKLSVIGRDLRARSANLVEIVEKTAEFSDLASIKIEVFYFSCVKSYTFLIYLILL